MGNIQLKGAGALRRIAFAMILCLGGALSFAWMGTVLPWMLGPLCFMALASMIRLPVLRPPASIQIGQVVLAVALGLYFTPPVLAILLQYGHFIAAGALFSISLGILCAWLLARVSGCGLRTAFFASMPGGASEMTVLSIRYDARPAWVAAAQALRVMLVVITVPPLITASGALGSDPWLPGIAVVHVSGLFWLILMGVITALALFYLNFPNAWFLGPLFTVIILTATGFELSAVPLWMINGAQLLIGCALGSRFTPDFFRTAPRFLAWSAAMVYGSIVVAAVFAFGLSALSGISLPTAVLAMAPGGIAEMSVTAKVLQLGVPVVMAFHVSRLAILVLSTAPVFLLLQRWRR